MSEVSNGMNQNNGINMTALVTDVATLKERSNSTESRLKEVETTVKQMSDIMVSLQKLADATNTLATNQGKMSERQDEMNARLDEIEDAPAHKWKSLTSTIFTTAISSLVGILLGAILTKFFGA